MPVFVLISVLLAIVGLLTTPQISLGPALIGLAILSSIYARIAQANAAAPAKQYKLKCNACDHVNPQGPATCANCGESLKGSGSSAVL